MLMRKSMPIVALLIAGCATQPPQSAQSGGEKIDKEVSRRVDSICSLPREQQAAEIEKLKKETGLVLFCGSDE